MYIGIPSWNYAGLACVYVEMEDGLLNKSVLFVFFFFCFCTDKSRRQKKIIREFTPLLKNGK